MSDIINLRQARKARRRIEDRARADANRMKFGRTKAERQVVEMNLQKQESILRGAEREHEDN